MVITLGCQSSDTGSIPVTRSNINKNPGSIPGFLLISGTGIERRRPEVES